MLQTKNILDSLKEISNSERIYVGKRYLASVDRIRKPLAHKSSSIERQSAHV